MQFNFKCIDIILWETQQAINPKIIYKIKDRFKNKILNCILKSQIYQQAHHNKNLVMSLQILI